MTFTPVVFDRDSISTTEIHALQIDAETRGDLALVWDCVRALAGDTYAIDRCITTLALARRVSS